MTRYDCTGYLRPGKANMYSVTTLDCLNGYTFQHEVGHNVVSNTSNHLSCMEHETAHKHLISVIRRGVGTIVEHTTGVILQRHPPRRMGIATHRPDSER